MTYFPTWTWRFVVPMDGDTCWYCGIFGFVADEIEHDCNASHEGFADCESCNRADVIFEL
jgi:hypothetical protein